MSNIYERASQILGNLKLTSDNVDMVDCYYLCANKQHIIDLQTKDHQVIWGRRGTGKTTLMKAFTYNTNYVLQDPETTAIYIVMASVIPTEEEIASLTDDGSSLALYVFSKLIGRINSELEKLYNIRSGAMSTDAEKNFLGAFYELEDYLEIYRTCIQGGEISIENLKSNELKKELGREISTNINASENAVNLCMNLFRNADIISYFKEVLVNTYLMGHDIKDEEKSALSDYIESYIFTKPGLRHLICGSQGVSRTFIILVKTYLQRFIKQKNGPVKLASVYEIIKHHYLEDVRSKIPYLHLPEAVQAFPPVPLLAKQHW